MGLVTDIREDGLAGLSHNVITSRIEELVEVGAVAQLVAGQLRPRLLRHRDDGDRWRSLRPVAASGWRSSAPRLARPTS